MTKKLKYDMWMEEYSVINSAMSKLVQANKEAKSAAQREIITGLNAIRAEKSTELMLKNLPQTTMGKDPRTGEPMDIDDDFQNVAPLKPLKDPDVRRMTETFGKDPYKVREWATQDLMEGNSKEELAHHVMELMGNDGIVELATHWMYLEQERL